MGFAMCASFAFAQTNNISCTSVQQDAQSATMQIAATPTVDYKASIFSKPDVPFYTFQFRVSDTASMRFGNNGRVLYSDSIDNQVVGPTNAHNQGDNFATWNWIKDTNEIAGNDFRSRFPRLSTSGFAAYFRVYMGPRYTENGTNDGFFLMSMWDQSSMGTGTFNAYVQLPQIPNMATSDDVIDIEFQQVYRKYYDYTYIDYKVGGKWKSREINVTGIDVEVNGNNIGKVRFTMPFELAAEPNIDIRFRYFSDGSRGNAYGYFWAIDHVTLYLAESDRWSVYDENYAGGGYGTIPQGMQLPLTWYTNVANTGRIAQTSVKVKVNHLDANKVADSLILSVEQNDVAAGDPSVMNTLIVDEQGLWIDTLDYDRQGWYGYTPNYGLATLPAQFQKRGLPTDVAGLNFVATTIESASHTHTFDTIAYRVSTPVDRGTNLSNVYIWARDNGVIPSQSAFHYGFTDYNDQGQHFVTSDGHYTQPGYRATVRYTTGAEIPAGWRILGVEYIVATNYADPEDVDGAQIIPVLTQDTYSGNTVTFTAVNTGVNEVSYTVSGTDDANDLELGVIAPGQNYKSIDIFFPEQPALLPNTSYRLGYSLDGEADFALASTVYGYANSRATDTTYNYTYYRQDSVLKDYYYQFKPGSIYDVQVTDQSNNLWAGSYGIVAPMVRMLVGPEIALPKDTITTICADEYKIAFINYYHCDEDIEVTEGTSPVIYFYAQGNNEFDSIIIDGVNVTPYDEITETGDRNLTVTEENVYDPVDSTVLFMRYIYKYTFTNINANHVVRAHAVLHNSISQVADNIQMALFPNPATSQVKIDIKGVSGMVNCSIIDMSGRVVRAENINAETMQTIDLKNIPAGAYFVRVTNDQFSKVEKLIVR